jgi:hypothetical protein
MPVNYITVDRSKQQGADLLRVVETLRDNQARLAAIKDLMDNMTDGVTYTNIETQFGVMAGKGDELYNLVAGAVSELAADTNFGSLMDWIVPTV